MSVFDDYADDLGGPDAIPKPKPGLDWGSLSLSAQEGFVLSRIDGATSLRDIVSMCGLGDETTLGIVSKLKDDELIVVSEQKGPASRRSMTQQVRDRKHQAAKDQDHATLEEMRAWAKFEFDASALDAKSDLSEVRKKRILYAFQRLDVANYYELLELEADASEIAVRKAYYKQTKRFHPDRYFRRDIGVFREYLGAIFKRLAKAYDVLSHAEGRRKYDLLMQHAGGGGSRSALEAARERKERAKRTYEVALSKFKAGVYDSAEADFRQALELDPGNGKYREMVSRAHKAGQRAIGVCAFRSGQDAERAGQLVAAATHYVEAAEHHASQAHLSKAFESLLASGGDLDKALQFAKLAVQMDSDNLDNLLGLAAVYEGRGDKAEARGALDQATALAPSDPNVLARLQSLAEGE